MDLYERNTCSFIVKVWLESTDVPPAQPQWRGHITHVFSGQRRYFENWATITSFIAAYLEEMAVQPERAEPLAGNLP